MPEDISFFSEKISFKLSNPKKTANWLRSVCVLENHALASLTYVFCTDEYLRTLNQQFLHHSDYTDILSFDYSEDDKIFGEIYISIGRVRENSKKYKQPFERELKRVIVHGLLHFIGYGDKTPQQKAQMRSKEEACLSLWK